MTGLAAPGALDRVGPALVAAAAVALSFALGWSSGFLDPVALAVVTLATAAAVAAVALGRRRETPATAADRRWPTAILAVGVAVGLAYDALVPPGFTAPPETLGPLRPLVAAAALVSASWLWRRPPSTVARLRFPAVLVLAAAMGALVIERSPRPGIDVWYFQQIGSDALRQGFDPYAVGYPNIYGPFTLNYSPAVLSPDRFQVLGNPYPPLTILLGLPAAVLATDVRWVTLATILLAAWGIRRLGRGSAGSELAAMLLLFQPRMLFVIEQAWTEALVLATEVVTLLFVDTWARDEARGRRRAWGWASAGLAAGLALTSKQYAVLLLFPVLFATPGRDRWKAVALAAAGATAVVAPFAAWDAQGFVRSVVTFQVAQPFRQDSLSWLAAVVRLDGPLLPVWPAFLLAAGALALGIRRGVSLDGAVLAGGAAWLVLVLFNKQAFCNYYWLGVGVLCTAAALWAARAEDACTRLGDGAASGSNGGEAPETGRGPQDGPLRIDCAR